LRDAGDIGHSRARVENQKSEVLADQAP
jgi:hypothetical protein